jgi:uncharacterized membrane protein YgcG
MGRDSGGVGSSRYITVKTGQGWLEVAKEAAGNSTAEQVAAYAVKLANQNKRKKPKAGMVVQNPVYQGVIGQTPTPSPYFGGMQAPSQVAALPQFQMPRVQGPQPMFSGVIGQTPAQRSWFDQINRPSMNLPGRMPGISLPAQAGPYQVQAPGWAANYQAGRQPAAQAAPTRPTTMLPDTQTGAYQRAPAMPAGFYPTPTMLPDTWAQSYPRTANAIAAQISSGYFPGTISALDQYQLQIPDELLESAGYRKQGWGGWARMGPARMPEAPASSRYGYGGYGGYGGRGGRGGGGGGSTPRASGGGGYGGGYSTSGRMLESATNGLVSWRI